MSQSSPLQKGEKQNDRFVPYVSASGGGGGFTGVVPVNQTYILANDETDRSFDADTATLTDVSNVLATLIRDLQTSKIIK